MRRALVLLAACTTPATHEITPEPMFVRAPVLAASADDSAFGVAWVGLAADDTAFWQVWFARVTSDGTLDVAARPVAAAEPAMSLCLVGTAEGWLLIQRNDTPYVFSAVRLAADGEALTRPVSLGSASRRVSCVANADGAGLLYIEGEDLRFRQLASDLTTLIGPNSIEPVAMSTKQAPVLVRHPDTGQLAAAWEENDRVRWAPLDDAGDPAAPSVIVDDDGNSQFEPVAAADGAGGIFVSWFSQNVARRRFMHVAANAWSAGESLIPDARSESTDLAVAGRDGEIMVAWQASDSDPLPQIEVGRLRPSTQRTLASRRLVSDPRLAHGSPIVAMAGARFAVGHVSVGDGGARMFLQTFD